MIQLSVLWIITLAGIAKMVSAEGMDAFEKADSISPLGTDSVSEYEGNHKDQCNDRIKLLKLIKERIKNGFYDSEFVNEDISYSFAKTLDNYL